MRSQDGLLEISRLYSEESGEEGTGESRWFKKFAKLARAFGPGRLAGDVFPSKKTGKGVGKSRCRRYPLKSVEKAWLPPVQPAETEYVYALNHATRSNLKRFLTRSPSLTAPSCYSSSVTSIARTSLTPLMMSKILIFHRNIIKTRYNM